MAEPMFSWSYSAIKAFKTCPRKFYHERVLKEYPFVSTPAAEYGKRLHSAIELYGKGVSELSSEFEFTRPYADNAKNVPGKKWWERKIAFTQNFEPCKYFDKQAWLRAQIDYMSVDGEKKIARVLDWKSGSSKYVDKSQLELMALVIMKVYSDVELVKCGLVFVQENRFVQENYRASDQTELWKKWEDDLIMMKGAYESGVWNPKQNGLCRKHCPVTSCEFNGSFTGGHPIGEE